MLQYNQKRNNRHKVVDLRQVLSLPYGSSNKAGLFIFACYSYQYRQAVQSEMNHLKKAGLKLHMYPFAPPPLFFKFGEIYHLETQLFRNEILTYLCPSCNT